ncbi:hypothetical protein SD961_05340 [Erwinia sp. MMLR14_017]|nr:hypothetical protein [Erwinia sp. MMLR14_017]MDW8845323.1 hypothetical protein [Erwinia sp. MMLR14_017]
MNFVRIAIGTYLPQADEPPAANAIGQLRNLSTTLKTLSGMETG